MKNRKSLFGLVMIVMVLVLGVGYAVVSSTNLVISGNASTETRDLNVVISAANPNSTSLDTYGTVSNPADKTATFTATNMVSSSDTRTVTYTVTNNESDMAAKVYVNSASDIVLSNSTYFSATTSITTESNAITIQPGQSATFTVTVGLVSVPIESANSSTTVTVTIKADPVAAS